MKRIFLIYFGIVISLSACIADADKRPHINDNEVWVCENPRAEFYWSKNDDKTSTIFVGEKKYNVTFGSSAGAKFWIYDEGAKTCEKEYIEDGETYKTVDTSALEQFLLLKCRVNYKKDAFDLYVEEDLVNMFDGEKPKLHFEKRNKAEYLKEIGEEP